MFLAGAGLALASWFKVRNLMKKILGSNRNNRQSERSPFARCLFNDQLT